MSLQVAAQHLASKGRDGDSTLVHMSPGEVKGLQALAMAHGGSLSINPDTGLVEASFLKRILPMVAGAALSPFITPMGAAALVGGFETVRTGDLGRGLMAGLGAYGGAGLTQGLSTAGAQTGAAGTTAAGTQATPIATGATENLGANALRESAGAGLSTPISAPPVNMGAEALKASVTPPVTMGNVGAGFSASPSAIYDAMPKGTMLGLGSTAVNALTPEPTMPSGGYTPDEYDKRLRMRLSDNFTGYVPPQPNPYYRPTGLGYAAQGGSTSDIMLAAGGSYDDEPMGDDVGMAAGGIAAYAPGGTIRDLPESVGIPRTGIFRDTDSDTARKDAFEATMIRNKKLAKASNIKLAPMPKTSVKGLGDVEEMAGGGSLGGYSDGGRMLKGPGDGMSDSIPATIGRKQPARLADGEFVVPADVVSHLGNGSTDAGAKRLYTMMDKVRKARTGKKKQAPAVKADRYMPA
jgi:hypothetical protein